MESDGASTEREVSAWVGLVGLVGWVGWLVGTMDRCVVGVGGLGGLVRVGERVGDWFSCRLARKDEKENLLARAWVDVDGKECRL